MNLRDYFEAQGRGSAGALAAAIGAHNADVSDWANGRRPVPIIRCKAIEQATGGAVTCRDLRPDDWQMIWPELAQPSVKQSFIATNAVAQGVA